MQILFYSTFASISPSLSGIVYAVSFFCSRMSAVCPYSDDTAFVVRGFPQRVQSFSSERNEWPAFTYQDGEYLITREAASLARARRDARVDSPSKLGTQSRDSEPQGANEQCSPRWSLKVMLERRAAEDMINIR